MPYTHLTIEEREQIQLLLWDKCSVREIAKRLDRNPSSISREIKRNKPPIRTQYAPRLANERALKKRKSRGRTDRLKNDTVRDYVVSHLKLGWSPEQIAGCIFKDIGEHISHEAIYQYIYAQIHRDGYGTLRPGKEDLRPYLARRHKRRARRGGRAVQKTERFEKLPSIHDRPKAVEKRIQLGHWEDDLIIGSAATQHLKTINERVSGLVFIERVKDATMAESSRAVTKRLQTIPKEYLKTLTRDRGSENRGYKDLEKTLSIQCFFADPYSSFQRGSNENLNGLIRRFFPKKTNFATITDDQIRTVEYLLNSRPRKRLGYKTPYEVFYLKTGVALDS